VLVSHRLLWELVTTNAVVVLVSGVAHLLHRINGEQASRVSMLVRIREVEGTVNDESLRVIPAKDAREEPTLTQWQKGMLNLLPAGL
jgi:hypothetical protein